MREPTADEQAGMDWWNALSETEWHQKLRYLIELKKEPTVAAAWIIEKIDRAHSVELVIFPIKNPKLMGWTHPPS